MRLPPALPRSAAILLCLLFSATACSAASLDEAFAKSEKTGAPLFVLVTSSDCLPCMTLKRRLETEDELQGLIKRYVGIHFDLTDPDYRKWTEKYQPRSPMVPMIFVVTSSGKLIYNDSGILPAEKLAKLLRYGLVENANEAEAARAASKPEGKWRAVERATKSARAEKYGEAIRILQPYLSQDEKEAVPGSDGDPVALLRAQLRQTAELRLDRAKTKLASQEKQIFGLLLLAETRRLFGELPELQGEIENLYRQVRSDRKIAAWVEQVETIDCGRAAELEGDLDAAVEKYREVMTAYPDAPASQLCAVRVRQIVAGRIASRSGADGYESRLR